MKKCCFKSRFCLKQNFAQSCHLEPFCRHPELDSGSRCHNEALNKNTFRAPLRSGFTLIELLVVVLIIGILASVALPAYQKAVIKSRYASLKPIAQALTEAEEAYYLTYGDYTRQLDQLDIDMPAGGSLVEDANGKKNTLVYDNWKCGVETGSVARVFCSVPKFGIGYTHYFFHAGLKARANKKMCRVYSSKFNDITHAICKQDSGLDAPNVGTTDYMW